MEAWSARVYNFSCVSQKINLAEVFRTSDLIFKTLDFVFFYFNLITHFKKLPPICLRVVSLICLLVWLDSFIDQPRFLRQKLILFFSLFILNIAKE